MLRKLLLMFLPVVAMAQSGKPIVDAIVNAAGYGAGVISPGEMVVIFGSSMGRTALAYSELNQSGTVASTVAGVQVIVNDIAAPIIYVSSNQIAAMVPYSVSGVTQATIQVTYQGASSAAIEVPVASSSPGIFSASASGTGQAAMTNADGSLNSSVRPA